MSYSQPYHLEPPCHHPIHPHLQSPTRVHSPHLQSPIRLDHLPGQSPFLSPPKLPPQSCTSTAAMPDRDQCPSHTRSPWGTSSHRCRPSLRHLDMGLLLCSFLAVVVLVLVFTIGQSTFKSNHGDDELKDAPAAGGIAFIMNQHWVPPELAKQQRTRSNEPNEKGLHVDADAVLDLKAKDREARLCRYVVGGRYANILRTSIVVAPMYAVTTFKPPLRYHVLRLGVRMARQ